MAALYQLSFESRYSRTLPTWLNRLLSAQLVAALAQTILFIWSMKFNFFKLNYSGTYMNLNKIFVFGNL